MSLTIEDFKTLYDTILILLVEKDTRLPTKVVSKQATIKVRGVPKYITSTMRGVIRLDRIFLEALNISGVDERKCRDAIIRHLVTEEGLRLEHVRGFATALAQNRSEALQFYNKHIKDILVRE